MRRLLLSPTILAQRELDGQLYPGTWTPLVSPDDTRRLREILNARAGRKRPEANRTRLAKRNGAGIVGQFVGRGELLRAAWEKGSLEWRRSIVGALLQHVEVLPGKAGRRPFDPQRVVTRR